MKFMPSPQPKVVVTHSSVDYTFTEQHNMSVVRLHENGWGTATVNLSDTRSKNYEDKVDKGDSIVISVKDRSESSYTDLFKGVIRRVDPIRLRNGANLLKLECDRNDYGLGMMLVGKEYGSESSHSTLDTIKEIVEDNTDGVVDAWVNKLLGTATDSGFSYTTAVETITGTISYVGFPFKPADRCLNDLCDIVQGIKGTSAGPHWQLIHHTNGNDYLCVATVGNHGSPASTYWPTWWNTDAAGSTLVEGVDFPAYKFEDLAAEANYVLYFGRTIKPVDLDSWTESHSDWGEYDQNHTISSTESGGKIGNYIKFLSDNVAVLEICGGYYPSGADANWNITNIGGEYNVPVAHFWAMCGGGVYAADLTCYVRFVGDAAGKHFTETFSAQEVFMADDEWVEITIPIGPYYQRAVNLFPRWFDEWTEVLSPNWNHVDAFYIFFNSNADDQYICIDNLYISGWCLRGARQSSAYSSTDPCKMKLITDDVAKDDSWIATDDTGTIGRLTYAEYLRSSSTAVVGALPLKGLAPTLHAGQLLHVDAKKKAHGTFRIDSNMRATRVAHMLAGEGSFTEVDVTSDVTNALPRPIPSRVNVALKAVRPEFQDRQASSIKTRAVDWTQAVLEKSY